MVLYWRQRRGARPEWFMPSGEGNWALESGGAPDGPSEPGLDDDLVLDENSGDGECWLSQSCTIGSLTITDGYAGTFLQAANVQIRYTRGATIAADARYEPQDFAAVLVADTPEAKAATDLGGQVELFDVDRAREVLTKALAEGEYDDTRVHLYFAALGVPLRPVFKSADSVEAWLAGKGDPDSWVNPLEVSAEATPYEERARRVALAALETWDGKTDFRDVLDVALLKAELTRTPLFKRASDVYDWAKGGDAVPIGWAELDPDAYPEVGPTPEEVEKAREVLREAVERWRADGEKGVLDDYERKAFAEVGLRLMPTFGSIDELLAWVDGKDVDVAAWVDPRAGEAPAEAAVEAAPPVFVRG